MAALIEALIVAEAAAAGDKGASDPCDPPARRGTRRWPGRDARRPPAHTTGASVGGSTCLLTPLLFHSAPVKGMRGPAQAGQQDRRTGGKEGLPVQASRFRLQRSGLSMHPHLGQDLPEGQDGSHRHQHRCDGVQQLQRAVSEGSSVSQRLQGPTPSNQTGSAAGGRIRMMIDQAAPSSLTRSMKMGSASMHTALSSKRVTSRKWRWVSRGMTAAAYLRGLGKPRRM